MRGGAAVQSFLVIIKHPTEGDASRIFPKRFKPEYVRIVLLSKPADFIAKFDTELIQLLLDLFCDAPSDRVSPCAGRVLKDLPTLCTGVYQLQEEMSGISFIPHLLYSVLQESQSNHQPNLQIRFRFSGREVPLNQFQVSNCSGGL